MLEVIPFILTPQRLTVLCRNDIANLKTDYMGRYFFWQLVAMRLHCFLVWKDGAGSVECTYNCICDIPACKCHKVQAYFGLKAC